MKITKEEANKYLVSLIQKATTKGQSGLSNVVKNYLQYLVSNFDNLDQEMQIMTDKILDESIVMFDSALSKVPDSPEVLQAKRLIRSLKGKLPTAKGLILGLEQPAQQYEPFILPTRQFFEKYLQSLIDTLYDIIEKSMEGKQSFVQISLINSSISELVCAFQLAQHGYANQAFAHIRTVLESLDLILLIHKDNSYAEIWLSNDTKKKIKELSPRAVRKELAEEKSIYSFLSEFGSHPTLSYIQTQSARKLKKDSTEKTEIVFWLGGSKWVQHVLWANSACLFCLVKMLLCAGIVFESRIHIKDYISLLSNCLGDFNQYLDENLYKWEKEHGLDTAKAEELSKTLFDEFDKLGKGGDLKI